MINICENTSSGASKEAISAHYDLGNEFYSMWLDPTMTYSAGLWEEGDDLEAAQLRKIDWHLDNLCLTNHSKILDIGCGWGSVMLRAVKRWPDLQATGLTLSYEQYVHLKRYQPEHVNTIFEGWENHQPIILYDGIVSIGAFEHFVKPGLSNMEQVAAYRNFFQKCSALLKNNTYLSLQTIVYENYDESLPNEFVKEVFPESDLPRLHQIIKASEEYFEIELLRNDRLHYAKTLKEWFKKLTLNRDNIRLIYGDNLYKKYIKYLGSFAIGFEKGTVNLARIRMKKKDL